MEITTSLPISRWYWYELEYWGLDYPPLTAYVSWVCGIFSKYLFPDSMKLDESRGYDTEEHRVFMRTTVLIADLLTWMIPVLYAHRLLGREGGSRLLEGGGMASLALCLSPPCLVLIDHGHFQYNCVCVGLAIAGAAAIADGRDLLGSMLFTLSLNFKQMALFYAPAFFFYLLYACFNSPLIDQSTCKNSNVGGTNTQTLHARLKDHVLVRAFIRVFRLGVVVCFTFGVLWMPFCYYAAREPGGTCTGGLLQIIHRLFPLARGIFEDKVANIWCCLDVVLKLRRRVPHHILPALALAATLILLVPLGLELFRPNRERTLRRLLLAMTVSGFAFFLAAYQVHEKSIILPLAPLALLWSEEPLLVTWLQVVGAFSLFPLLQREGLAIPYTVCTFAYICGSWAAASTPNVTITAPSPPQATDNTSTLEPNQHKVSTNRHLITKFIVCMHSALMVLVHVLEIWLPCAPEKYPHLFAVLNAVISCFGFVLGYLMCFYWLWTLPAVIATKKKLDLKTE